jgi:crossover junction endodeoxyribonuclease RuvC
MIVLGIDPGTAALGYGVVERRGGTLRALDVGCVTTSPDLTLPERLLAIDEALTAIIARNAPGLMGVERLFFTRNVQSAFAVGHARGVVLLAAARAGIPVREATPNEVKVAVAGYGSAEKEQVGRMVATILGLEDVPTPDDAADALAVAICVANREREGEPADAGVLDRSAIAPISRGESPYDRAVREALARDRAAARSDSATTPAGPSAPASGRPSR